MTSWLWDGNKFVSCATVPIEDRGFRYGMSVFETIAILGGKPQFLVEHLARLKDETVRCGFDVSFELFTSSAMPLAEFPESGVVRVYVTADCRVLLLAEKRQRILKRSYVLSPETVIHLPFPAGSKSGNYWRNVSAMEHAKAVGFDEALLVSPEDVLISACMANVFVVKDGELKTPSLSSGTRNGIIREWIKTRRPVVETELRVPDLITADEIFLTNSWIGVMPVTGFRGERRAPGEITLTLREELERHLHTA